MKQFDYFPLKTFLLVFLALLTFGTVQAQIDSAIKGRVTDEANVPLPGVTISIKGTSTGTITDAQGFYTLPTTNFNGTLVFSFVGYNTKEVAINNRSTINESLTPDTKALEEVVVV